MIFLLLFLITIYVILGKRKVRRNFLLFLVIIIYYFCSTPFLPYILLKPLEEPFKIPSKKELASAKAIVLLTGGTFPYPDLSLEERFDRDSFLRVLKTMELKKEFPEKPLFIIGGDFRIKSHKSASFYKDFMEKFGVKNNVIVIENVFDTISSVKALKKHISPDTKIIVVTSAYHLKRSVYLFKKFGFTNVIPYPSNYNYKICTPVFQIWKFFPKPIYLEMTNKAIHEYLGLAYYKLRYK